MLRREAEALVGKRVHAYTSANGEYIGELVEVLPTRPWRAVVRVTGVTSTAALEYGRNGRQRWGKRPGQLIEVGGVNVCEATEAGHPTYLGALEAERLDNAGRIRQFEDQVRTFTASGDSGSCSRAQSDLSFCQWYDRELATLIAQEPERLERIAAGGDP